MKAQCSKILNTGNQCSFPQNKNSEFCKRHSKVLMVDNEANTSTCVLHDVCTNTKDDYHSNVSIVEETILNMLNEISTLDAYIEELE